MAILELIHAESSDPSEGALLLDQNQWVPGTPFFC